MAPKDSVSEMALICRKTLLRHTHTLDRLISFLTTIVTVMYIVTV